MALSAKQYTASGTTTDFPATFTLGYLSVDHIHVFVDEVEVTTGWSLVSSNTVVRFDTAPISGAVVLIRRITPNDELVHDYADGALIIEENLDESNLQALMLFHEAIDGFAESGRGSNLNMGNLRITNVADPVNETDAMNYRSALSAITTAQASAEIAENNAELAVNWAVGPSGASGTPSDTNNAEYWANQSESIYNDVLDASDTFAVKTDATDTGAIIVPSGTSAQVPVDTVPWLRYDTDLGKYMAFYPSTGLVGELVRGVFNYEVNSNTSIPVISGDAFILDVTDEVDRTVIVPDTFNDGEYFALVVTNKPSPSDVIVTVNLTSEFFALGDGATYDSVTINCNTTRLFQKVGGLWYSVGGTDGLESRLSSLEGGTVLHEGSLEDSSVTLSEAYSNFERLEFHTSMQIGSEYIGFSEIVNTTQLDDIGVSVDKLVIEYYPEINDSPNRASVGISSASGNTITFYDDSTSFVFAGCYRVIGYGRK